MSDIPTLPWKVERTSLHPLTHTVYSVDNHLVFDTDNGALAEFIVRCVNRTPSDKIVALTLALDEARNSLDQIVGLASVGILKSSPGNL